MKKICDGKGRIMEKHKHERSTFSGKIGFVLSAAGASVGLGNIWRFPYLAAKYGGGIFLLIYIILALTFGYSMIVAETALGRMTKKSPVGAFGTFGKSKWLSLGGWINAIIPVLIVPYYSVIGGWVIKYLVEYVKGGSQTLAEDGYFSAFIADGFSTETCFLFFTLLTLVIIYAGVQNGVERVSKVMMPIAAIATCLLISRVVGTKKIEDEVLQEGGTFRRKKIFNFMIKYLCPIFAAIILFSSVANAFGWISM